MARRKTHRAVELVGGPEDGHIDLVRDDIDDIIVTSTRAQYTYALTRRFVGRRRVYELVTIRPLLPQSGSRRDEQDE